MTAPSTTILLAWERGSGLGHISNLLRLAPALRALGWRPCVVAAEAGARAAAAAGIDASIAPDWPSRPADDLARDPAADDMRRGAFDEVLRHLVGPPEPIVAALRSWRAVLDRERPAAVVADYAPLATLAARGSHPIVQIGGGYSAPPCDLERPPALFSPGRARRTAEAAERARVGACLRAADLAPLPRLGALFDADAAFVVTTPWLDPYRTLRRPGPRFQAVGPLTALAALPRAGPDADAAIVYLRAEHAAKAPYRAFLERLAIKAHVFSPGLPADAAAALQSAGHVVHTRPTPIAPVTPRARLVIHHGGLNLATEAAAAGAPQLVLPTDAEKLLTAHALERGGAAAAVWPGPADWPDAAGARAADLLRPEAAAQAQARADHMRGEIWRAHRGDAASWVAARIDALARAA